MLTKNNRLSGKPFSHSMALRRRMPKCRFIAQACLTMASLFALSLSAPPVAAQSALTDPDQSQSGNSAQIPYDMAALKAQAETQMAVSNSQKAAADAKKAAIEAEVAAAKAKFGSITGQTAITGTTTVSTDGPKAEALLLVTKSMRDAGDFVAGRVATATSGPYGGRTLLVLTDLNQLSTADAIQFEFQSRLLLSSLKLAENECQTLLSEVALPGRQQGSTGGDRSLLAVGAAIDAAAKLGSYFQSDYTFGNVAVTEPTNLLAGSVVAALRNKAGQKDIIVPSLLVSSDIDGILEDIAPLHESYISLVGLVSAVRGRASAIRTSAPGDAQRLDSAEARATKAITSYESFLTALTTTSSASTEMPIIRISRQQLVRNKLASSPLILLVTSEKAAAYYTKKNLWTFLGGPPLYTMGGVSLVYMLIEPSTNNVLAAGVIPKHGGYHSVGSVERIIR